jgi:Siphovirus Gp157
MERGEHMSRMTLYSLSEEGIQISDILTENEGELTPELEARLDALMLSGQESMEAAAMVVKQLEGSATACEEESKRLRERAKAFSDNAQRLKDRMVVALDSAFNGKIKTPLFTIWAQSTAPTVVVDLAPGYTAEMLHDEHPKLVRVKMEIDRPAVLAAWKAGEELPETIFFGENPGTRYCRIK